MITGIISVNFLYLSEISQLKVVFEYTLLDAKNPSKLITYNIDNVVNIIK